MKKSGILAKIFSLALVLCMLLSFVSCDMVKNLFGGSLELVSFTVDRSSVKTEYYVGEEIDFTGIRATIKYTDEALNKELVSADLKVTYPEDITATEGQKDVTVSYDDPELGETHSTKVTIIVSKDPNAVEHESYRIDASAVDTTYYLGETVDLTGLKLFDVMSNKTEVEITDLTGLTYNVDGLTATAGNKDVTFTYNGESAGVVTFRVIDPEEEKNHVLSAQVSTLCNKTTYEVGETLDLAGLTVTVTYEEGEPQVVTTGFTFDSVDMSTTGTKQVKVKFLDPINGEEEYVYINITVLNRDRIAQFEKPESLKDFENANTTATQDPNASNFTSHFSVGGQTYAIGDDNNFKLVPKMKLFVDNVPEDVYSYYMNVEIQVNNGAGYVRLDKAAVTETKYTYSLGGELLVTVDTYNGLYKFEKPIDRVSITVTPHADHYRGDVTPVTLIATVIDAYNVHEAWQLAVIEQNDRGEWDDIKTAHGITDVNPAGVILHNDIKLTYKDVPETFFYTSDHAVEYYNTLTGETKKYHETAGMRYFRDNISIFVRTSYDDFFINGNFFTIDTTDFPLVASPSIFGAGSGKDYGSNYSNANLFLFEAMCYHKDEFRLPDLGADRGPDCWTTKWGNDAAPTQVPEILIKNVYLDGNAGTDSWVIKSVDGNVIGADGELVTAGGLYAVTASRYAEVTLDNVVSKCFFITYCVDFHADMDMNNVKVNDSYQSALYAFGDVECNINNTYMNVSGGPVIMAQSVFRNSSYPYYNPTINITGGDIHNAVTGQEAWFLSVGGVATVNNIAAIGTALNGLVSDAKGVGANFSEKSGSNNVFNMQVMLCASGSSATAAMTDPNTQGTVNFNGGGISRWQTGDSFWAPIWQLMGAVPATQKAPFLTVKGANGQYYSIFSQGGAEFYDLTGRQVTAETHAELLEAFAQADEIIFTNGGMSILFELYH